MKKIKLLVAGIALALSSNAQTIGQYYGGGIVFYLDQSGTHGLIADTSDVGIAQWGCYGTSVYNTTPEVGSGSDNTSHIVSECNDANFAAKICNLLVANGYSDWYLPSLYELSLMYSNRNIIGGFKEGYYWSSTESNEYSSWTFYFGGGYAYTFYKNQGYYIRAIRSF
jgi:hypothetical protein